MTTIYHGELNDEAGDSDQHDHAVPSGVPVPRDGETISPSGCVVLRGRAGQIVRRPGKGLCTWCGQPVTAPRRKTWCGQFCVDAYQATQPAYQRNAVFARDGGTCALCGLDTERLRQAVARWAERRCVRRPYLRAAAVTRLLNHMGWTTSDRLGGHLGRTRLNASWWDMDHRTPIVDGGHPYSMANLRTLCAWCHVDETGRAATARAEARRGWVEPEAAQVELFKTTPAELA